MKLPRHHDRMVQHVRGHSDLPVGGGNSQATDIQHIILFLKRNASNYSFCQGDEISSLSEEIDLCE